MTDHLDPLDPLDELASAHLDGETTPEEAARIDSSADLTGRVARLAAARQSLQERGSGDVDPERREQAILAALAAFDDERRTAAPDERDAPIPLVAPARRSPSRRTLQLVGIAAAVVLLALAVPLLGGLDSGSEDDTASSELDATSKDDGSAGDTLAAGGQSLESAPPQDSAAESDLGAFDDVDDLSAAVRAALDAPSPAASSAVGEDASAKTADGRAFRDVCVPDDGGDGGTEVYRAGAALDGRAVLVVVRTDGEGHRTMTVLDREDCSVITARLV